MPKNYYTPSLSRLLVCALYHETRHRNICPTKMGTVTATETGTDEARSAVMCGIIVR